MAKRTKIQLLELTSVRLFMPVTAGSAVAMLSSDLLEYIYRLVHYVYIYTNTDIHAN